MAPGGGSRLENRSRPRRVLPPPANTTSTPPTRGPAGRSSSIAGSPSRVAERSPRKRGGALEGPTTGAAPASSSSGLAPPPSGVHSWSHGVTARTVRRPLAREAYRRLEGTDDDLLRGNVGEAGGRRDEAILAFRRYCADPLVATHARVHAQRAL
jgi:hypothetical protein